MTKTKENDKKEREKNGARLCSFVSEVGAGRAGDLGVNTRQVFIR